MPSYSPMPATGGMAVEHLLEERRAAAREGHDHRESRDGRCGGLDAGGALQDGLALGLDVRADRRQVELAAGRAVQAGRQVERLPEPAGAVEQHHRLESDDAAQFHRGISVDDLEQHGDGRGHVALRQHLRPKRHRARVREPCAATVDELGELVAATGPVQDARQHQRCILRLRAAEVDQPPDERDRLVRAVHLVQRHGVHDDRAAVGGREAERLREVGFRLRQATQPEPSVAAGDPDRRIPPVQRHEPGRDFLGTLGLAGRDEPLDLGDALLDLAHRRVRV